MAANQTVICTSWPDHLVPICTDGRANKPFPYVLDVAHLLDYGMLPYYPTPTAMVPAASPFQQEVQRRSSVASVSGRRRSTFVAFGEGEKSTDVSSLAATFSSQPQGSSPTGTTAAASTSTAPSQHFEMIMQPVGTFLLMGASLQAPLVPFRSTDSGEPPVIAGGRTLSDDERYYSLRLPNQHILLKPRSAAQEQKMVEMLSQWIRVANQQMFNSRLVIVKAEFAALPSRVGASVLADKRSDTADEVRHLQEQRAHREDLEFCRGLSSATFGLGCFSNAREAVGERGVPEDVVQKQISLGQPGDASSDNDTVALRKKYATLLLPFTFGSLDKIAVCVKHETLGVYVPAQSRSALSLMQLVAQHDGSRAPFTMELAPTDGGIGGAQNKGWWKVKVAAMVVASCDVHRSSTSYRLPLLVVRG